MVLLYIVQRSRRISFHWGDMPSHRMAADPGAYRLFASSFSFLCGTLSRPRRGFPDAGSPLGLTPRKKMLTLSCPLPSSPTIPPACGSDVFPPLLNLLFLGVGSSMIRTSNPLPLRNPSANVASFSLGPFVTGRFLSPSLLLSHLFCFLLPCVFGCYKRAITSFPSRRRTSLVRLDFFFFFFLLFFFLGLSSLSSRRRFPSPVQIWLPSSQAFTHSVIPFSCWEDSFFSF